MLLFAILTAGTLALVGVVMAWFFVKARDVPDEAEADPQQRRRLRPDTIRLLTYVLAVMLCLLAATFELWLYYG